MIEAGQTAVKRTHNDVTSSAAGMVKLLHNVNLGLAASSGTERERERELACTARRQAQSSSLGISFFGQLLICVLSPWNVGCATKLQGSRRMQLTSPGQ